MPQAQIFAPLSEVISSTTQDVNQEWPKICSNLGTPALSPEIWGGRLAVRVLDQARRTKLSRPICGLCPTEKQGIKANPRVEQLP